MSSFTEPLLPYRINPSNKTKNSFDIYALRYYLSELRRRSETPTPDFKHFFGFTTVPLMGGASSDSDVHKHDGTYLLQNMMTKMLNELNAKGVKTDKATIDYLKNLIKETKEKENTLLSILSKIYKLKTLVTRAEEDHQQLSGNDYDVIDKKLDDYIEHYKKHSKAYRSKELTMANVLEKILKCFNDDGTPTGASLVL